MTVDDPGKHVGEIAISRRRAHELQKIANEIGQGAIAVIWLAFGGIGYLVHAAGIVTPAPLEKLSPEVRRQQIDVNLNGAFYVMRQCALPMRDRRRGGIVAITSDLSFKGVPNFSHDCVSKADLAELSKSLARTCPSR